MSTKAIISWANIPLPLPGGHLEEAGFWRPFLWPRRCAGVQRGAAEQEQGLVLEGVAWGCFSPRDAATSAEGAMPTPLLAEGPAAGWAWFLPHASAFLFASP